MGRPLEKRGQLVLAVNRGRRESSTTAGSNPVGRHSRIAPRGDDPGLGLGNGGAEKPGECWVSRVAFGRPGNRHDFGVDLPRWGAQRSGKSGLQAGTKTLGRLRIEAAERVRRRARTVGPRGSTWGGEARRDRARCRIGCRSAAGLVDRGVRERLVVGGLGEVAEVRRGGVRVGVGAGLMRDAGGGEVQGGEADDPVGRAVADELEAVVALATDAATLKRRENALDAPSPDLKGGPLDCERSISGAGVEGVQARVVPRPRRLRLAARRVDRAASADARVVLAGALAARDAVLLAPVGRGEPFGPCRGSTNAPSKPPSTSR